MWSLVRPDADRVARFLDEQRTLAVSYDAIGATAGGDPPDGFAVDHNRALLGRGGEAFVRASAELRTWRMFPAPWTAIEPPAAPIATGETIAVVIRTFGVWWLNAARIVYVVDEPRRYGFAYGTLPGHAERGEERFTVEWSPDDSVWYDLRAFSRPRYWMARVGYPLTRALQRRFARESMAAIAGALAG